ncbi:MAG TPA: hypothetical protein VJ570_06435, partial [Holophagaceae bacterium]|nr:hypothetical protein [Holophagaceae bacterium]
MTEVYRKEIPGSPENAAGPVQVAQTRDSTGIDPGFPFDPCADDRHNCKVDWDNVICFTRPSALAERPLLSRSWRCPWTLKPTWPLP